MSEVDAVNAAVENSEMNAAEADDGGGGGSRLGLESTVLRLRVFSPDGDEVVLDGISTAESVQSLRTSLAEHPTTAHFTAFTLSLDAGASAAAAATELITVGPDGSIELNGER